MSGDAREFRFRRRGMFSPFWTAMWGLITVYFLWRTYQTLTCALPVWMVFVPVIAIVYMWAMRLWPVKIVSVAGDGRIVFDRYLGRRETYAIYVKRIRPWFGWSRKYFVLRHTQGFELLFEDPEQTAEVARELARLNPELEVRGIPPLSETCSAPSG